MFVAACTPSHEVLGLASSDVDTNYILNPNPDPALKSAASDIITSSCFSCHGPGGQNGFIDINNIIEDGFVIQGAAEASILFKCINKSTFGTNCTTRRGSSTSDMASFGGLTANQIDAINVYIDDLFIDP